MLYLNNYCMNLKQKISEFINENLVLSLNLKKYKNNDLDKIKLIQEKINNKLNGYVAPIYNQNNDNLEINSSLCVCQSNLIGYEKCLQTSSFLHDYHRNKIPLCWKHSYLLSIE